MRQWAHYVRAGRLALALALLGNLAAPALARAAATATLSQLTMSQGARKLLLSYPTNRDLRTLQL